MTQQEILKYNKRCAEFLKLELAGPGFPSGYFYNDNYYHFEDLKFHSDWNWIHEVIEAIKNTTNPKEHSNTTFSTLRYEIQSHLGRSNKEAVVHAINQFLIWYNENKTNQ